MIQRRARATRARGFTLTDLMISVAIVGVLSVIAYVGYHKLINSSHLAEAGSVLGDIKVRQERYKAETGSYLNVSVGLAQGSSTSTFTALYPHCVAGLAQPGASKVAWGGACPQATCCAAGADWAKLQVETHGPVYYGYSSVAGGAGASLPAVAIGGRNIAWPTATGPWFMATAVGDTDGNGTYQTAILTSFDNELRVDKESE
jgi:prepilin-type N-terminal cleavage/methylation domain-containing protein